MKFKKTVSAAAALAMSVSAFAGIGITARAATPIYSDNFEAETAAYAWTGNAQQAIVADNATQNKKNGMSYSIFGASNGRQRPAWSVISSEGLSGKINVNLNIRMDTTYNNTSPTQTFKLVSGIPTDENNDYSGNSLLELSQSTSDGGYTGIYELNGNSITSLDVNTDGYSLARETTGWLNMDVAIDTLTKTFDITLSRITNTEDGYTIAETPVYSAENVAFMNDVNTLNSIMVFTSRYPTYDGGKVWLDDISISLDDSTTPSTTHTITIEYKDTNGNTIKENDSAIVYDGTSYTPSYDATFNQNGYKYTYISGGDTISNITQDTTITLIYSSRLLATTNVTLNLICGETMIDSKSQSVIEDSTVTIPYSKYIITPNGALYTIATQQFDSSYYSWTATGTQDNQSKDAIYKIDSSNNAIAFIEAESLGSPTAANNADIRCSNAAGLNPGTETVKVIDLDPGTYTIEASLWGTANNTYKIVDSSENVYWNSTTNGSILTSTSDSFTVNETTTLYVQGFNVSNEPGASGNTVIDYILIRDASPAPTELTADATLASSFIDADGNESQVWEASIEGSAGTTLSKLQATATYTTDSDPNTTLTNSSNELDITDITGEAGVYAAVVLENTQDVNISGVTVTLK